MEAEEEAERKKVLMERGRRVRDEREQMERERKLGRVTEDRENGEEGASMDVDWESALAGRGGATEGVDKTSTKDEREGTTEDADNASMQINMEGAPQTIHEAGTTDNNTEGESEILDPPVSRGRVGLGEADDSEKIQGIGKGPEAISSSEDEDDQL